MINCPECNALLDDDTKFCHNCGIKIDQIQRCPKCDSEIEAGAKFCSECGAVVNPVEIAAVTRTENIPIDNDDLKEISRTVSFEDDCSPNDKMPNEFCKYCGSKIDKDTIFCPKCGKQLDSIQANESSNVNQSYSQRVILCVFLVSIVILVGAFAIYKVLNNDIGISIPQYTQDYSDDDIVNKALNTFKSKIKSKYGGGVETMYHGASVNSSVVEFDPYTNKYTCTLNATYTTNMFDFFGTSSTSYVVKAVYYDTGSELIAEEFNIS